MKRFWFALAGLAALAVQSPGPAQVANDPGRGYEVTPAAGPWLVLTTCYTGPQAKELARQLAEELRTTYKLPAYVFCYDEDKKKEEERVNKLREQQLQYLRQMSQQTDPDVQIHGQPLATRIHIRRQRFEDQCGVLVGGYADQDTAFRELKRMKQLKPPDPHKVALNATWIANPQKKGFEVAYLSPFNQAFVVRNPTVKAPPPEDRNKPDPFLKKLNENEQYNLLKCRKPWTLAVTQFRGPTTIQSDPGAGKSFLAKLGLGASSADALNATAVNAHNVAELLRKLNFEAYVLHTRYASVVTVGGFDRPDDPQLQAARQRIQGLGLDRSPIPMLSPPLPMQIPQY